MKNINKIENMIEGWLKPLPHIPAKWTKMIAENLWWIVGIGIILSVIGIFSMIGVLSTAAVFLERAARMSGYYNGSINDGWFVAATVVSLAMMIASAVLLIMAFNPLKTMHKKGWDLLFIIALVSAGAQVLSLALNFNIYNMFAGLLSALVGIAIGMYLLFEIKSYFKSGKIAAVEEKK
ncbi:MAG: hypothetical protein WCP11_01900 [Candidatus Saccharibacteria bacterium]